MQSCLYSINPALPLDAMVVWWTLPCRRYIFWSMQFDLTLFLSALGLAFILESIPYFLFAERMPSILNTLAQQSPSNLRRMGFTGLLLGVLVIYLGQSF